MIAVTGHKGFIGTNLTNYLKQNKIAYTGIDLPEHDLTEKFPSISGIKKIIHLASNTDIRESLNDPEKHFFENLKMTWNVLDFASQQRIPVIFTSSAGAPQSFSPYSASKMACESMCRMFRTSKNIRVSVLRLTSVYGPHSLHKNSVIHKFIRNILDKKPLEIYGNGKQCRDFIYVEDVIDALINCFNERHFIVSTGKQTSLNDLANIAKQTSKEELDYEPVITHSEPVRGEVFKISAPPNILDFVGLRWGFKMTLKWYQENYAR